MGMSLVKKSLQNMFLSNRSFWLDFLWFLKKVAVLKFPDRYSKHHNIVQLIISLTLFTSFATVAAGFLLD